MDQELLTFPEHPSSRPVFVMICVALSLIVVYCRSLSFVLLDIQFFVLLRFTTVYYPFGILLFLCLFCWQHTIYTDRSLQPNVGSSRQTVQIIKFNSTFVLLFLYQNHSFTGKSSLTWWYCVLHHVQSKILRSSPCPVQEHKTTTSTLIKVQTTMISYVTSDKIDNNW